MHHLPDNNFGCYICYDYKKKSQKLKAGLKKRVKNAHSFKIFDSLDSTNTFLKTSAEKQIGDICIAITQTGGRGRGDKPFYSFGEGLYMSLLYRPDFEIDTDTSVRFTCSAAVAVCESIRKVTSLNAEIKWVNDIYIGQKKVCGILTELVRENDKTYVIVGIGVNLVSSSLPTEISKTACALYNSNEPDIPKALRAELASEIINRFDELYKDIPIKDNSLVSIYRGLSFIEGKEIDIIRPNGLVSAEAVRICDDFSLEVRYGDTHIENLTSGEVSLRIK